MGGFELLGLLLLKKGQFVGNENLEGFALKGESADDAKGRGWKKRLSMRGIEIERGGRSRIEGERGRGRGQRVA